MNLLDELTDAYLDNNFGHPYYLDLVTSEVILDLDEDVTGVTGIDWDDEENEDRYLEIPEFTSDDAYRLMEKFANQVADDKAHSKLFNALNRRKPFRNFKDALFDLGLRDEWYDFEKKNAQADIKDWLEINKVPYEELAEKPKGNWPYK
jgi:hypothetical protein